MKEAGRLFPGEKGRNTTRKSIGRKLVPLIEVMACDVFGEMERKSVDYTNESTESTEDHTKIISLLDDMDLPF